MSTKEALLGLAAASLLAFAYASPVYAEDMPEMEEEQVDDSANPDVDPGASKGPDEPIPEQEQERVD